MVNLIQIGGNEIMSKVIDAVFEGGVFKPIKKLRLKDKQQVKIQILNDEDWQVKFDRALKAIRAKTAGFPTAEIEADVEKAVNEVRNRRRVG